MTGRATSLPQTAEPPEGVARSRAYDRAVRHSRRVRFFKRAIPLGAVGAVALIVGLTWFNPFGRIGGLSLGPISVSGTRVVMERPRLTGFQKDTRPYEVTAEEASQDVRKPTLIDLKTLRARVTMDDAGAVGRLEAATGRFDTQKEILELTKDVHVTSSSGYSADLKSATVDFKAGSVVSRESVRVGVSNGVVEAETMAIADSGKVITFEGNVRSVFVLGDAKGDGSPAGAPAGDAGQKASGRSAVSSAAGRP